MQDKKVYIVLIAILVIFFLIMFFTKGTKNILEEKDEVVLIIDESAIWNYQNKRWNALDEQGKEKENWQKFNIYIDNQSFGNYYLYYSDKWYIFDDNRQALLYEGDMLAYRSNYEISILNFQEQTANNNVYIESVLKNHGISAKSTLTSSSKITVDFDQDGMMEDFYAISNAFSMDSQENVIFSFAFMVKENKIYMLYEELGKDYYSACKPYYKGFINVDRELPYEVIFSCGRYSVEESLTGLYQFSKNGFETIISNQ